MAGMTYGYSTNIIGSSLAQPSMAAYFDFAGTSDLSGKFGGTASLYNTGALVGFIVAAWIADRFGRKAGFAWTAR
jgi:MFS family permease